MPAIDSGGAGACRSRGRREAMPKPVSLTVPVVAVHQDICRLDVLVDEAAPMDLRESRGDLDGEAQKAAHFHGRPEQPVQRLALGVLEHQHRPTAFADELQRSHRPRPVQVVLQAVFASKASENGRRRMLRGWQHSQHGGPMTAVMSLSSAEDAFAVRPQDLETTIFTSADPRGWNHVPDPPIGRWPPLG